MNNEMILRKPNATLVMVPRAGKLTAIERKLLNSVLLTSVDQHSQYRALHGQEPANTHLYTAHADTLLDPIEVGKSNLKSALRKHMLALRMAIIDWEAPDARAGVIWRNLSVLSQVSIEIRDGGLFANWAFPPEINQALADSQSFPFTKLDLDQISKLRSYTAVALYEICARYRNNYLKGGAGECFTSSNAPDWWVDALTNIPPKIDKVTKRPLRREWRKVKNEAVNKAINEINELTDLNIELVEAKDGKAISKVQFVVRQKPQPLKEIEARHFPLVTTGLRLGLSESLVLTSIRQTSVEHVTYCISKLEARLNQKDAQPIEHVQAYFGSIVREGAQIQIVQDAPQRTRAPETVAETGSSDEPSRHTVLRQEFMVLAENEKRKYAELAIEDLKSNGLATPKILMKAEEGVWSGILLSKMVEAYAGVLEPKK